MALKRISVYLDEDEVTEQVSSLKKDLSAKREEENPGLGLSHAVLKWNEITENDKDKSKDKGKNTSPSPTSDTSSETVAEPLDHQFELRDITVQFPEAELTVVTGPTASGKTALLVRHVTVQGL